MIIYSSEEIERLLNLVNSNNCHLKKWKIDMSEIVDTTEQEKSMELDNIRLAVVNDHQIHTWERDQQGIVIQKTQQEMDSEELSWREYNFDYQTLMGYLYQEMEMVNVIKLSQFSPAIQSMVGWVNYRGIRELLEYLVSSGIATQEESSIVTAGFLQQGIVLGNYQ